MLEYVPPGIESFAREMWPAAVAHEKLAAEGTETILSLVCFQT